MTDSNFIDYNKSYTQITSSLKPQGLWYGINNDWIDWCQSEQPDWIKKNKFNLEVETANLLKITNQTELRKFCNKYKNNHPIINNIEWNKVAEDYYGIEITNYHKMKYRFYDFQNIWFYGWDVDSGCIWNLKALIKFIKS